MTKPLALKENQVRTIIRAARKEGYAAVLQVGNLSVKLVPEEHVIADNDRRTIDAEPKGYF